MRYLAILKDSIRETLDCKTLWVLGAISTVIILLCASVSFQALTPEESLADIAQGFNAVVNMRRLLRPTMYNVDFTVRDARASADGEYTFVLRAAPAKELHRLVRHWDAVGRGKVKEEVDAIPDFDVATDFELQRRFIGARMREKMFGRVTVEPGAEEPDAFAYNVRFKTSRPELVVGAHRMGILFGLTSFRLPLSVALTVSGIQSLLAGWIAGLVGVVFAIVVTASFVPDMLQKGRIDILLSKPIARATLLGYKYLGGLFYVLLNAAYLIGGCWLALAVRSGHWDPSFLWSIAILTLFFAVLYSFSTWVGVVTRSPIVAILSTIGLWFVSSGVGTAREFLNSPMAAGKVPGWGGRAIDFVYYLLPKTSDLGNINDVLIVKGNLGEDGLVALPQAAPIAIEWALILGTSGGFLVVFLGLACIVFARRDY